MAKILYCDEDEEMLQVMGGYLEDYGCAVMALQNVDVISTKLKQESFDLFICSATLEPQNGYDLCLSLREDEGFADFNILIVGPSTVTHEQSKLLMTHNIHYIIKYKGPEAWFEKISKMLRSVSAHEKK